MAVNFGVAGVRGLITGVVIGVIEFPAPVTCRLNRLRMQIAVANEEGDTLFDVKVNGVSIYESPVDRPKILAGETVSESFPTVDLAEGDTISVDVVAAPLGGITGLYVLVQLQDSPTAEQYVEQMYLGALKREPTEEELDDQVLLLQGACAASTTLDDTKALIDLIFNSDEYDDLATSDEQFIEDLYQAILARPSDPGGKALYLSRIGVTWTRQQLQDIFNFSTEHINVRVNGWCAATLIHSNAVQLQGRNVSNAAPTSGQLIVWNSTSSLWEPASLSLPNDIVTNAKLSNMAAHTFKGNNTVLSGDPVDMSAAQATAELNVMVGDSGSGGSKGLVGAPASGDATKFWRGDASWATPAGGGSSVSWLGPWSSATTYAANNVVTYRASTFLAIAASTNVTPGTDTSKWVAIAGDAVLFEDPPAAASTLELWLRGDWTRGRVADLGFFSLWCDGSGKGRNAVPGSTPASIAAGTYSSAPVLEETGGPNSKACIRLDGGPGSFLWLPGFQRASWPGAEIMILFKNDADPPASGFTGHLVGGWGTAASPGTFFTDSHIYDDFGQSTRYDTGDPSASLTSWRLYNVRLTPSTTNGWQLYIDSTLHFQTNSGALSWSARKSMIGRTPGNSELKTRIAEIAFFSNVLSSGDRTTWKNSWNTRYSLSL